jgi:ABC-type sugar transport system ATPase subunit
MTALALEMRGISKTFPGVRALSGVDLLVKRGTVHAIVGENGAGKSTLMKILSGLYPPSAGEIRIDGGLATIASSADALRRGIAMVHQELNLAPDLTVAENVFLGRTPRRGPFVDRTALRQGARAILADLGTRLDPDARLGSLTISQRQLVEIAKAHAARPRIVVLDEPTSSLSEHKAQALFEVIARMKAAGTAILYISHRLREVLAIADEVTVLRDGALAGARSREGLTAAEMIRLMVGREVSELFPKRAATIGAPLLQVEGLADGGRVTGVSLEVRAGEIVGLTGLVGAGRSEVARAIVDLGPRAAGTIRVGGRSVSPRSPAEALAAGIAYVPEDRKGEGIVPTLTVRENVTLPMLAGLSRLGWVRSGAERRVARAETQRLGVSPADPEHRIGTLSGGNQQKVVIARWLAARPSVLILDEPTRGVDVGAKAEIHAIIGDLVAEGMGVLMISSEMPEVMAVSDRVVVMHEGRAAPALERGELDERRIMALATGEARI